MAQDAAVHSLMIIQSYALSQLMGDRMGLVERLGQDNMRDCMEVTIGKALDTNVSEGGRHLYVRWVMIALP
jgi:hypothetical protein